jgi:hypothetical protein
MVDIKQQQNSIARMVKAHPDLSIEGGEDNQAAVMMY